MTIFRRQARAVLAPFSGERPASMTPTSELALTSLVVVALVASATIIAIAALGPQARYSLAGPPGSAVAARPGTLDKAEFEVLDLGLYPACISVGDGGFPSAPGERAVNPDHTILQDSADRAFVHESLASAKGARASEGSPAIPRSTAEPLPRPKRGSGLRIGDPGCDK
jgi:hypothetical protein